MDKDKDKVADGRRPWRTPEIIEVGTVLSATEGEKENVRDPGSNPATYSLNVTSGGEVDLDR